MYAGGGYAAGAQLFAQALHHGWRAANVKVSAAQIAAGFFDKIGVEVPRLLVANVGDDAHTCAGVGVLGEFVAVDHFAGGFDGVVEIDGAAFGRQVFELCEVFAE